MQVYENRSIEELDIASKELRKSLEHEGRMLKFAAWAFFYKFVAIGGMIVLTAIFDHSVMRYAAPMGVLSVIFVVDTLISSMQTIVWKDRQAKEKAYFDKSRAVTDYNTERILQCIAITEISSDLDGAEHEARVIN